MKLTKTIREDIIKSIISEKQEEFNESVKKEQLDIVKKIVRYRWDEEGRPNHYRTFSNHPERWHRKVGSITIYNNSRHVFGFKTAEYNITFPYAFFEWQDRVNINLPDNHELLNIVDTYAKKEKEFYEYKKELSTELNSLLCSVTTVNKLLTLWPDGKKYYEKYEHTETRITVNPDRVNKLLNS